MDITTCPAPEDSALPTILTLQLIAFLCVGRVTGEHRFVLHRFVARGLAGAGHYLQGYRSARKRNNPLVAPSDPRDGTARTQPENSRSVTSRLMPGGIQNGLVPPAWRSSTSTAPCAKPLQ